MVFLDVGMIGLPPVDVLDLAVASTQIQVFGGAIISVNFLSKSELYLRFFGRFEFSVLFEYLGWIKESAATAACSGRAIGQNILNY